MKTMVRTYLNPETEGQIKILAHSSGMSVSAIVSELIEMGLLHKSDSNAFHHDSATNISPILQEQLYLSNLILRVMLSHGLNKPIGDESYANLRVQSQEWAASRIRQLTLTEV